MSTGEATPAKERNLLSDFCASSESCLQQDERAVRCFMMNSKKGVQKQWQRQRKQPLFDLSNPWGHNVPLWPYFPDVKIERFHYHAKSRVLSQQITTFMHCSTHTDAPAHVIAGKPFIDEVPLDRFYGTAVIVDIPKKKWEVITPKDLEKARPKIEKDDIVIINSGWHRKWGDNTDYFV